MDDEDDDGSAVADGLAGVSADVRARLAAVNRVGLDRLPPIPPDLDPDQSTTVEGAAKREPGKQDG